jgi:RNA polymerase sigma factor (TIGR02999 family)
VNPRDDGNLVTRLLAAWRHGDPAAPEQILTILYEDLHALAIYKLGQSAPPWTLQPSDLVHEAYIKLLGSASRGWDDRRHFIAAAITAMKSVIVDRARARTSLKRGGGSTPLSQPIETPATQLPPDELLAVHDAITKLESTDPRAASILTLRCFGGLDLAQTALVLDVSERIARRDWEFARRWLRAELRREPHTPEPNP